MLSTYWIRCIDDSCCTIALYVHDMQFLLKIQYLIQLIFPSSKLFFLSHHIKAFPVSCHKSCINAILRKCNFLGRLEQFRIIVLGIFICLFNECSYNNRKKSFWKVLYLVMVGSFLIRLDLFGFIVQEVIICLYCLSSYFPHSFSLGCSGLAFLASYENYPSGYALKYLHESGMPSSSLSLSQPALAVQDNSLVEFTS